MDMLSFNDKSGKGHDVTHTARLVSAEYVFSGGSYYFNGSDSTLDIPYDESLDPFAEDFTLHFWFKRTVNKTYDILFVHGTASEPKFYVRLYNNQLQLLFWADNNGSVNGDNVTDHDWHHVAVCRKRDRIYLALDGHMYSPAAIYGSLKVYTTDHKLQFGYMDGYSSYAFTGYMDELQFVKYRALWTSNFTVPQFKTSGMSSDIKMLVSGSMPDLDSEQSAFHADITNNGVSLSNAQTMIFDKVLSFDGSSYFDVDGADIELGFVFDVSFFVWLDDVSVTSCFFSADSIDSNTLGLGYNSSNGFYLYSGTHTDWYFGSSNVLQARKWHHVCLSRRLGDDNYHHIYVDGRYLNRTGLLSTSHYYRYPSKLRMGAYGSGATNKLDGYIDNFIIRNGFGRYRRSFYPYMGTYVRDQVEPEFSVADETALLLNFGGTDGDNTIRDGSRHMHGVTNSGNNVELDDTQYRNRPTSAKFTGGTTASYLSVAAHEAFDLLDRDFQVDLSFRLAADITSFVPLISCGTTSDGDYWILMLSKVGSDIYVKFNLIRGGSTVLSMTAATAISLNQWYDVRVDRVSGKWGLYLDGIRKNYSTTTDYTNVRKTVYVGGWSGLSEYFSGWMDGLRVRVGYTGVEGACGQPAGELPAHDRNLHVLFNAHGQQGDTGVYDESMNRQEAGFNSSASEKPVINTSVTKFGTASYYFDSSYPSNISIYDVDWCSGQQEYTLEGWFYFLLVDTQGKLFSQMQANAANKRTVEVGFGSGYVLYYYIEDGSSLYKITGTTVIQTGQWYHIAAVRSATTLYLFLNGQSEGSMSVSGVSAVTPATGYPFCIGKYGYQSYYPIRAYVESIRISNIPRYTSNFTVPARRFSARF